MFKIIVPIALAMFTASGQDIEIGERFNPILEPSVEPSVEPTAEPTAEPTSDENIEFSRSDGRRLLGENYYNNNDGWGKDDYRREYDIDYNRGHRYDYDEYRPKYDEYNNKGWNKKDDYNNNGYSSNYHEERWDNNDKRDDDHYYRKADDYYYNRKAGGYGANLGKRPTINNDGDFGRVGRPAPTPTVSTRLGSKYGGYNNNYNNYNNNNNKRDDDYYYGKKRGVYGANLRPTIDHNNDGDFGKVGRPATTPTQQIPLGSRYGGDNNYGANFAAPTPTISRQGGTSVPLTAPRPFLINEGANLNINNNNSVNNTNDTNNTEAEPVDGTLTRRLLGYHETYNGYKRNNDYGRDYVGDYYNDDYRKSNNWNKNEDNYGYKANYGGWNNNNKYNDDGGYKRKDDYGRDYVGNYNRRDYNDEYYRGSGGYGGGAGHVEQIAKMSALHL